MDILSFGSSIRRSDIPNSIVFGLETLIFKPRVSNGKFQCNNDSTNSIIDQFKNELLKFLFVVVGY